MRGGKRRKRPIRDRFWKKVDLWFGITDDDCWLWCGAIDSCGRARMSFGGRNAQATRVVYEMYKGPTGGLHVLHTCDTPACVNPSHLFLGTHDDNMADKSRKGRHHNQQKTHCIHGHPLSGSNLYYNSVTGHRQCKVCRNNAAYKYQGKQLC